MTAKGYREVLEDAERRVEDLLRGLCPAREFCDECRPKREAAEALAADVARLRALVERGDVPLEETR